MTSITITRDEFNQDPQQLIEFVKKFMLASNAGVAKITAAEGKASKISNLSPVTAIKETAAERKKRVILELRREFSHLEGVAIGRSDAAKKYNLHRRSINNWELQELEPGTPLVQVFERNEGRGNQVMLHERDIAVMVAFNERYRQGKKGGPVAGFNTKPRPSKKAS